MKLYVAIRRQGREGMDIGGIFSTPEAANTANEEDKPAGDHYSIEEFDLDDVVWERYDY